MARSNHLKLFANLNIGSCYMAKCSYCGSETELYSGGVPICVKCSNERDSKRKPDDKYPSFISTVVVPGTLKPSGSQ